MQVAADIMMSKLNILNMKVRDIDLFFKDLTEVITIANHYK